MDQESDQRFAQLEAQLNRIEAMLQALIIHMDININQLAVTPSKPLEPPDIVAIREALFSGDKMKAIMLYHNLYNVGLKEARDAINAMQKG